MPNQTESPNLVMREHDFAPSESRGGAKWYSKQVDYEGRRAQLAVKDEKGLGLPMTMDAPVRVALYDLDSGDKIAGKSYPSLRRYLELLQRDPSQRYPGVP